METITLKEANATRRLLIALAHPDDETFGPAGTIIRYARSGVAVHVICATRGEVGHVDPELLEGYESLADLRTQELLCAARHLGLAGLHLLDYRDSGMEGAPENQNPASLYQAPMEQVVGEIAGLIRQIRPQVVITFDRTGGYFHPDHVTMHTATTQAFHAAGDPERFPHQFDQGLAVHGPQKLYYTAFPLGMLKLLVRVLPLFGQDPSALGHNNDIDLRRVAAEEQAVTTKIDVSSCYEASRRASQCYASQNPAGGAHILRFVARWLFRFDRYARAVPSWTGGRTERDLFAGIDG
ncbi:MAG: GlcNAc-PI de-N-acetylase [Anaerolineae bacterium]|nr:GlcNAc-PI de-N-acetylase [Anaerolineae bacterium]